MIDFHAAAVEVTAPEGRLTILHPATLTLAEPRISVIGANGSGKSTFARLLNGLVEPTSGSVRVQADSWLDTVTDGAAVRRRVGFTFSDPGAQLVMPTALEDVALSLRRRYRRRTERDEAARAALERFGIGELADRSVHTLSGGQRQLLACASVLATDPAILVADEPTTLLDLRNSRMIGDLLMSLPQQVVLVTHDLDLAARADRTLVIDEGRVVFDGDPAAAVAHYRGLA
ncbi:ABC transporter ATP-binding protein [Leucobacter tardus]|uniref:Energy-coupling factor ABC transporter ATP-binding protein n=1 Tax=Leucobacter tardus TaxID=501483 RepID=A0A939QEB7_9MICO|nr:energy-coupling factor ABC transporter ATP-binding protein [Leucobacter tardus]MBO2988613.1 energy-coupling factor ABC transporter ATP-binding protein [Leucobacter tardus]